MPALKWRWAAPLMERAEAEEADPNAGGEAGADDTKREKPRMRRKKKKEARRAARVPVVQRTRNAALQR